MWRDLEVFVEPILPKTQLIIIGGGHVGKAVTHLAKCWAFTLLFQTTDLSFVQR